MKKIFYFVIVLCFVMTINSCNKNQDTKNENTQNQPSQTPPSTQTPPPSQDITQEQNKQKTEQPITKTETDVSNVKEIGLGEVQLKLMKISNPTPGKMYKSGSDTKVTFELINAMGKKIDKYWLDAELKGTKGENLGDVQHFMFKNVKKNGKAKYIALWDNVRPQDVGEITLKSTAFEVDGKTYKNAPDYTKILDNKLKIKVHF